MQVKTRLFYLGRQSITRWLRLNLPPKFHWKARTAHRWILSLLCASLWTLCYRLSTF